MKNIGISLAIAALALVSTQVAHAYNGTVIQREVLNTCYVLPDPSAAMVTTDAPWARLTYGYTTRQTVLLLISGRCGQSPTTQTVTEDTPASQMFSESADSSIEPMSAVVERVVNDARAFIAQNSANKCE